MDARNFHPPPPHFFNSFIEILITNQLNIEASVWDWGCKLPNMHFLSLSKQRMDGSGKIIIADISHGHLIRKGGGQRANRRSIYEKKKSISMLLVLCVQSNISSFVYINTFSFISIKIHAENPISRCVNVCLYLYKSVNSVFFRKCRLMCVKCLNVCKYL